MTSELARALRNSLGFFATGVCVVTCRTQSGGPQGLTINSFSSVSLDPPLILWSLDRASDMIERFSALTPFCVNILGQDSRALSQRLSRKAHHALNDDEWVTSATGAPVLRAAIAHFDCTPHAQFDGGDHVIMVGRVQAHAHHGDAPPLLYYRGKYRDLADLDG